MKQFMKKYGLLILACFIMICIFGYYAIQYKIKFDHLVELTTYYSEGITNGTVKPPFEGYNPQVPKMTDAFSLYFQVLRMGFRFIITYFPLLILFSSGYYLYTKLNSGMIRGEIMRENYKEFLKKHLKIAYKSMLIIPIFLIISFLICFAITGRIDIWENTPGVHNVYMETPLEEYYIEQFPSFLIIYIINLVLMSGYYINVLLLFLKKKMPYLISCIASFLVISGISVFLEIIIGEGAEIVLQIPYMNATFNSFCFWLPGDHSLFWVQLGIALTLFLGSFYLVYQSYKNKEQVLIAYEL